ncbi:LPXTG cell wall anchor domain-containing protein [Streptomyces sp. G44]|uniref:LAETG motif-containing sortase-dependent surface protein n=1 Tax=Streptomyces sp. G44 TaxID=2807632 RepID=UPI001960D738|nr:LAETG motif-containing sortase-dependent surface protein [Streptomyces sp. G44]MBM7169693.1 LPXTG cell wall anchor domain-containing protein [Streptomyces sp. G44]
MKLRRAMAAAAATAVVAPLALLSAPAAFAAEGSASTSTTTDAPKQPPAPTQDATQDPPKDPTQKPTEKTPLPKPPAEKPTKPTKPTTPTKPPTPSKPGGTAEDEDNGEDNGEDEGTKQPAECEVADDSVQDPDSVLEIELSGLPDKIVAGSGWHPFELSATNPTDEPLGEVEWTVFVNNKSKAAVQQSWLRKYATLQYRDPETDAWKSIKEGHGGLAFDVIDLDAEETADIELRLSINAKAPAGKAYAIGLGDYVDSELDCTRNSFSYKPLTIRKSGDEGEHPGTPKPKPTLTPTAEPSATPSATAAPQPQGTADGPVNGSLAETGSSSALPAIGLVGGAAVVVGAGAVFVVRRRKSDTAA